MMSYLNIRICSIVEFFAEFKAFFYRPPFTYGGSIMIMNALYVLALGITFTIGDEYVDSSSTRGFYLRIAGLKILCVFVVVVIVVLLIGTKLKKRHLENLLYRLPCKDQSCRKSKIM